MPFDDTTYIITSRQQDETMIITHPGGKDITIHLQKDRLPMDVDSISLTSDTENVVSTTFGLYKPAPVKQYEPDNGLIFSFLAVFAIILVGVWKNVRSGNIVDYETAPDPSPTRDYLTYYGDELGFSDAELVNILTKRFPYYNERSSLEQIKFVHRLKKFLSDKTFKIHDDHGFKEMPVLISAAAIQLTFGLDKYLLPNFQFIHVYPQEFMRVQETICLLEGNVSGHAINLSWKHFLEGYSNVNDGQNVGVHEMSHALYYQTFIAEENVDSGFRDMYDNFVNDGNKAFDIERTSSGGLYSDYAVKNFQEFWAESAELFFEKPAEMKGMYPELYETIKMLLNQDPLNKIASVTG